MIGFLSAIIAIGLTYAVFLSQSGLIQQELSFLGLGAGLTFISGDKIFALITVSVTFSVISSFLTVRKINTGWAASSVGDPRGF
ncbi:MAG: hypothetical protein R2827_05895 [Bdellovibrionales bacterium]